MAEALKGPGRPTAYKAEYCEKLIEYFSVQPYQEKTVKKITKNGEVAEVTELVAADFPSFAGFCVEIGVCRDTLSEWKKVHPEFSAAYKKAKELQERFVVINGNKGLINTAFGIFTAKNVLGWRDKVESEVTNSGQIKIEIRKEDEGL